MPLSPVSLTLRLLRRRGFLCDTTERWVPKANVRRDLFQAFDVVGLHPDVRGVLGVQVTVLRCLSARVRKLRSLATVAAWLASGNRVELHGWCKRAGRWHVKRVVLTDTDLAPVVVEAPRRRLPNRHTQGDLWAGSTVQDAPDAA